MEIHLKNGEGDIVAICDHSVIAQQLMRFAEIGIELQIDVDALVILKSMAIEIIEKSANRYHTIVVGTPDKNRETRFALNLELAQKLLAGTASAVEQQTLQVQLDANQQTGHPVLSGKTLEQFAQWIVQYKNFSIIGSGLIESTLIKGRAAINAAQSIEEIEQIKQQLAAQAQASFEQLQAQFSS